MKFPHQAKGLLKILKYLIPDNIRLKLRRIHQQIVFKKAIAKFKINYTQLHKHPELLDDLVYGWGNMGWSSFQDYSKAIVNEAQLNSGSVLECGSGLSTLLLGIIAQDNGFKVWSLEHHKTWAIHVEDHLKKQGITSVTVCHVPLKNYGLFEWYDVAATQIPNDISLVICDGPPHDTMGGRFGLFPVVSELFKNNAVILLDDYVRNEERVIVDAWKSQYEITVEAKGDNDQYAHILYKSK